MLSKLKSEELMKMKCTQCKNEMKKVRFDVGYGIEVDSLHCDKCGFNMTEDKKLSGALAELREQMSKEVKIVRVGTGLGVRLTNEIVKSYNLRRGENVLLKPEVDGVKLFIEHSRGN